MYLCLAVFVSDNMGDLAYCKIKSEGGGVDAQSGLLMAFYYHLRYLYSFYHIINVFIFILHCSAINE